MKRCILLLSIILLIMGCSPNGAENEADNLVDEIVLQSTAAALNNSSETDIASSVDAGKSETSQFIRAKGRDLVVGPEDEVIYLRGINFSNYIWNQSHDQLLNLRHHQKSDYERVAAMGMNVVRLNLSTYHFESDEEPYAYLEEGWEWLDREIVWAKDAGVYLILNIHFAPGMSADTDIDFWQNPDNLDRTAAVWRQIAMRYKDEPTIAGYDLFNEPEPPSEAIWADFVDEMVTAIREEDQNHLIVLEAILSIRDANGNWSPVENPFIAVEDDNVMYDFHFYLPFEFTHQKMEYAGIYATYTYPNERVYFDWDHMEWQGSQSSDTLAAGTTDWAYYDGEIIPIKNKDTVLGKPNPFCSSLGDGKAYFGDFVINAFDTRGNFIEEVVHGYVEDDQTWWFWSSDGTGNWESVPSRLIGNMVMSTRAIVMTGTQKNATVSNADFGFVVHPAYQYAIDGWMKGENIASDSDCHFSLELYSLSEGEPVIRENRDYLEKEIQEFVDLAEQANVPLNMGEFGVNWYGWQENRGAEQWFADVFHIAVEKGLHFQSWAYHDIFGIYLEWDVYPDDHEEQHINILMLETLETLFAGLQ